MHQPSHFGGRSPRYTILPVTLSTGQWKEYEMFWDVEKNPKFAGYVVCSHLPWLWHSSNLWTPLEGKRFLDWRFQHHLTRVKPSSGTSAIKRQSMVAGIPQPRGPASQRGRVCRLWWHLMIQSHTGKGDQKRHHATEIQYHWRVEQIPLEHAHRMQPELKYHKWNTL